jgi:hypothetical protein
MKSWICESTGLGRALSSASVPSHAAFQLPHPPLDGDNLSRCFRSQLPSSRTAQPCGSVIPYRIAKDTGVVKTCLIRFMRDETSLRLDKADALADYLGLELVKKRKRN